MRLPLLKRISLGLVALLASAAAGYAVNITGTNSSMENQVVRMGYQRVSTTDAITAFAGGGQANAVLLDSSYNRVSTVATAADSVKLPSCHTGASNTAQLAPGVISGNTIGLIVWVTNAAAANSMNVYPQTGESVNALSANAAYAMAANKTSAFICGTAGIWLSNLGA